MAATPADASAPRRLTLRGTHDETPGVRTFHFEKPYPEFVWKAGQNLVMTIPGLEDPRGPTRPFTISSSPTEGGVVAVTTLLRESPFKRRLAAMVPGDSAVFDALEGEFFLEPGRPAVMVAGGIGVTPFRSMLRYAADRRLEKPLVLVYSSKTPEEIIFRRELDELTVRDPAIRIFHTITRPEAAQERWTERTGRIDGNLLREALRGVRHPLVYLAGPPGLVREIRRLLGEEIHLSESDLRTDEFDGY